MNKIIGCLAFFIIWCAACAFVDYVVPDAANAYQMLIGWCAGAIALKTWNLIDG